MPIVEFENRNEDDLVLTVSPWGDVYKIPHLASAGIRYTLKEGEEDRCYTSISDGSLDVWCNADTYEFEVVSPSAYDRLMWRLAVGGWCGGPTHVSDLLPSTGMVGAKAFAKLVMLADGWLESEPLAQHHLDWIEEKFIEHLGPEAVSVDLLRPNLASAFDPDAPA